MKLISDSRFLLVAESLQRCAATFVGVVPREPHSSVRAFREEARAGNDSSSRPLRETSFLALASLVPFRGIALAEGDLHPELINSSVLRQTKTKTAYTGGIKTA